MKKGAILVALGMLAGGAPARAGEGRIPIWQPVAITAPGSYVVTQDITATSGPILDVQVGGVSVDLNGHTLTISNGADPLVEISSVMGIEPEPFHLADGWLVGGGTGLHAGAIIVPCVHIADVTFAGQTSAAISIAALADLEAKGIVIINNKTGFDLHGTPGESRAVISDAVIQGQGGILCDGMTCAVRDTQISIGEVGGVATTPALRLQGSLGGEAVGIIIVNNRPSGTSPLIDLLAARGIIIVDSKVLGPADTTGGPGIAVDGLSADVTLDRVTVSGMGMDGIAMSAMTGVVRGALLSRNGGHGLFLGGSGILVEDVKADGNGGAGLWFETSGHVYRNTVLLGNSGRGVDGPGAAGVLDGGGNIE